MFIEIISANCKKNNFYSLKIFKNIFYLFLKIQDIESRSALVRIQPPRLASSTSSQSDYSIDFTNLIYELLLSDKGQDAKYKQVYWYEYEKCFLHII
jgi:hypothetical protein